MKISQKEIIANKAATKVANQKLNYIVIGSSIFVLLYHFLLLRWEAPTKELYYMGVLFNALALSVVTGYIFYYITVLIPHKNRITAMKPAVIASKNDLADLMNRLIALLIREENWIQLGNESLKTSLDSRSTTRKIWIERCSGIFKTNQVLLIHNPYTLLVISDTLNELQNRIEDILQHSDLFEEEYLKQIVWLINTDTYKKLFGLRLNSFEQLDINENDPVFSQGETLLDDFFRNELSFRLFVQKDGKLFIDEVRKLSRKVDIEK